jgi:hypothetical protein
MQPAIHHEKNPDAHAHEKRRRRTKKSPEILYFVVNFYTSTIDFAQNRLAFRFVIVVVENKTDKS